MSMLAPPPGHHGDTLPADVPDKDVIFDILVARTEKTKTGLGTSWQCGDPCKCALRGEREDIPWCIQSDDEGILAETACITDTRARVSAVS